MEMSGEIHALAALNLETESVPIEQEDGCASSVLEEIPWSCLK
jgi:hypothetical protein